MIFFLDSRAATLVVVVAAVAAVVLAVAVVLSVGGTVDGAEVSAAELFLDEEVLQRPHSLFSFLRRAELLPLAVGSAPSCA